METLGNLLHNVQDTVYSVSDKVAHQVADALFPHQHEESEEKRELPHEEEKVEESPSKDELEAVSIIASHPPSSALPVDTSPEDLGYEPIPSPNLAQSFESQKKKEKKEELVSLLSENSPQAPKSELGSSDIPVPPPAPPVYSAPTARLPKNVRFIPAPPPAPQPYVAPVAKLRRPIRWRKFRPAPTPAVATAPVTQVPWKGTEPILPYSEQPNITVQQPASLPVPLAQAPKVPQSLPKATLPVSSKADSHFAPPAPQLAPLAHAPQVTQPISTSTLPISSKTASIVAPASSQPAPFERVAQSLPTSSLPVSSQNESRVAPASSTHTGRVPLQTGTFLPTSQQTFPRDVGTVPQQTSAVADRGTSFAKPVVAVFGGTGQQGGNVAKALLNDGKWTVRIFTRNPDSPKALKFAQRGAQIIQGNQANEEDLRRFLSGADAVFALTDYYGSETKGNEEAIASAIAKIARESGVRQFIWSTLPNVEKISGGKWNVPHFTHKSRANKFINKLGFDHWTFLRPSFYFQNFATFFAPKKEGNILVWTLPMLDDKFITAFDVRDMGPIALQVLRNPQQFHQQKINLASEHMHPQDYIIKLGLVSGIPIKVVLERPSGADEISQMFGYFSEHTYFGGKDWQMGKKMFPQMRSWEQYLRSQMPATESL